jgi:hypothetical protein
MRVANRTQQGWRPTNLLYSLWPPCRSFAFVTFAVFLRFDLVRSASIYLDLVRWRGGNNHNESEEVDENTGVIPGLEINTGDRL